MESSWETEKPVMSVSTHKLAPMYEIGLQTSSLHFGSLVGLKEWSVCVGGGFQTTLALSLFRLIIKVECRCLSPRPC